MTETGTRRSAAERALGGWAAPVLVGAMTAAVIGWLWGSLNPLPWVYDEAAYLLQAKIFATWHWSAPGRPVPEFFEQVHVFVTPRLVPRYPPGHALLLVPGIWLGASALMPLLFSAVTGGLVFGVARRLANGWVALMTWLVWITAPEELYLRPSFMSQTSSTLIWLLAWIALARWQARGDRWALIMVAMFGAYAGVIRPITAVALLIPVGVVVLNTIRARPDWAGVGMAAVAGLSVAALGPLWSFESTGRAFPTPYSEYSRVYTPWNLPGFRVDTAPPLRPEIPAISKFRREWLPVHQSHRIERLPIILAERIRGIVVTLWGGPGGAGWSWRYGLVPLALLGFVRLPSPVRVVGWGAAALVLVMLSLASRPLWTVYYLEVFPLLAFATGLGAWRAAEWVGARSRRADLAPLLVVIALVASVPGIADRLVAAKDQQVTARMIRDDLARAIAGISGRAIVFVAPGPAHRPHEDLVSNEPDVDAARVWVVHDRGADNARLLTVAPGRTAYRFDPADGSIVPFRTPAR